jgi:hypothetical protein
MAVESVVRLPVGVTMSGSPVATIRRTVIETVGNGRRMLTWNVRQMVFRDGKEGYGALTASNELKLTTQATAELLESNPCEQVGPNQPREIVMPPAKKVAPVAKKAAATTKAAPAKATVQATVTLKHLAAELADNHDLATKRAEAVLGDLVTLATKHLKKGDKIRLTGLGILQVRKRAQWSIVPVKCWLKTSGTPSGLPKRR